MENKKTATEATQEVTEQSIDQAEKSNGNHFGPTTAKPGGAERGGPQKQKADQRQPPDQEDGQPEHTANLDL